MKPFKIYGTGFEEEAMKQFYEAMKQPCVVQGALMPDAHSGFTLPIGAVVATRGMIFPSWVGKDIGCGVLAIPTSFKREDVESHAKLIFDLINDAVPLGFKHHAVDQKWLGATAHRTSDMLRDLFKKDGLRQMGTLGGGNHFIEIGHDQFSKVWITVHSGSRNIGNVTGGYHMGVASGTGKAKEGNYGLPVNTPEAKSYMKDHDFCAAFALENRMQIARAVEGCISHYCRGQMQPIGLINRTHNHVIYDRVKNIYIHRKGATHAEHGMLGVVPGNMRDGVFIVEGKGSPDSLYSSSHGAGRKMSRSKAKTLDMGMFKEHMVGITANVSESTLDESPAAYKNIFEVMESQRDLVTVVNHIKPIINVKG